jgi:hypothetical protein
LRWRRAEEAAAAKNEPWAGRVDDVAADMIVEPVTVNRWRRTVPSVRAFRAWLHEAWDGYEGMCAAIDRGDFDSLRAVDRPKPRTQADYLAEVVPMLDAALSDGETPASAHHLARILGVSARTVRRHRPE